MEKLKPKNNPVQALLDDANTHIKAQADDNFQQDYRESVYSVASKWIMWTCVLLTIGYGVIAFTVSDMRALLIAVCFVVVAVHSSCTRRLLLHFGFKVTIRSFIAIALITIFVFSLFQATQFVIIGTMGATIIFVLATILESPQFTRILVRISIVEYTIVVVLKLYFNIVPIEDDILHDVLIFGVPVLIILIIALALTEMNQYFINNLAHVQAQKQQLVEQSRMLEQVAQELSRSNRELENFAYIASHDLREPLRKIKAFSGRLEVMLGEKLDETEADYFRRLVNAATRMQTLIDDLLAFSRVRADATNFEILDLNVLIDDILEDIDISIKESNAQIIVDTLPAIEADRVQMRQVFQNLIVNAIKYAKPDIPPQINIKGKMIATDDTIVGITVTDNGIGFEQQYAERIFGIFERLHSHTQYTGSGIGLAICRKIMELHHGSITVQSEPNQGTIFTIQMPKKQD